jgi:hypothetical protein
MSYGKFIVEVYSGFSEGCLDLIMKDNSCFDQRNIHFLYGEFKSLEMSFKECFIDSYLRRVIRDINGNCPEVSLVSWVDIKRS